MNEALESQTQVAHLKIIASFSLLSLAIHLLTNRAYAYFATNFISSPYARLELRRFLAPECVVLAS